MTLKSEDKKKIINKIFGPRNIEGSALFKGPLIISDASLPFYPVRSLKELYALITCLKILRRSSMPHTELEIPPALLKWIEKDKILPLGANLSDFQIDNKVYFEDLYFSVGSGDENLIMAKYSFYR